MLIKTLNSFQTCEYIRTIHTFYIMSPYLTRQIANDLNDLESVHSDHMIQSEIQFCEDDTKLGSDMNKY